MISEAGNRILERMPPYYLTSYVMRSVWDAQGHEIDRLNDTLDEILKQFFVNTATWGLEKWETALGLPVDESKAVEERRANILAKLRASQTATHKLLQSVAESFEYGVIKIVEDIENYALKIIFVDAKGVPPNVADFQKAMRETIPAHLNFEFVYNFFTWQELDDLALTWDGLDALQLTWDELEVFA